MKKLFFLPLIALLILSSVSCKKDKDGDGFIDYTVLYWTTYNGGIVGKISLSAPGSSTNVATGLVGITHIKYEASSGFLFVANEGDSKIYRISSDGVVVTLFDGADGVDAPTSLVINGSKLIWANSGTEQIMTANKDGSGTVTTLYGGAAVADYSYGMAINGNKLYYSDFSFGIFVGNLDGTGTPTLLYASSAAANDGLNAPSNIKIDASTNRIYWSDESDNAVCYAPLNGSGPITKLYDATDGIARADGIDIDFKNKKIYWSETSSDKIKRANLDGSGSIEEMLTGIESYGIALGK
jgi:hypothetical protein